MHRHIIKQPVFFFALRATLRQAARGIRESRSGTSDCRQVVERAVRLAEPLLSEKKKSEPGASSRQRCSGGRQIVAEGVNPEPGGDFFQIVLPR